MSLSISTYIFKSIKSLTFACLNKKYPSNITKEISLGSIDTSSPVYVPRSSLNIFKEIGRPSFNAFKF